MKKHLTLSQRIHNAEGAQAAEYLHAKHAYLHGGSREKEEYSGIWSRSDYISWAHGFGRWRGFEAVWYGHVANYNLQHMRVYPEMYTLVPEIAWLTDFRPLSEVAMHSLSTDVIEVADDGQTARGFFITPGVISSALTSKMTYRGFALWERYGSDFVFEDGEWKYLHEQVCPDVSGAFDASNMGVESYKKLVESKGEPGDTGFDLREEMHITDPGPLHFSYSLLQTVQNTVPWPEPYATMDNDNTYTKKL